MPGPGEKRKKGNGVQRPILLLLFSFPLACSPPCARSPFSKPESPSPVLFTLPTLHIPLYYSPLPPYLIQRTIGSVSSLSTSKGLLITFHSSSTSPGAILSWENAIPLYPLINPTTFEVHYRLIALERPELCLGLHIFAFSEETPRARYGACTVRTVRQSYLYITHALGGVSETTLTYFLPQGKEQFIFRMAWDWGKKRAHLSLGGITLPVQVPEKPGALKFRLFFLTGLLFPEQQKGETTVRFQVERIAGNLSNGKVYLGFSEGSLPKEKTLYLDRSGKVIPITSPIQELPLEGTSPCFLYPMATQGGERFQVVTPLSPHFVSRFFPNSLFLTQAPETVPFWN